MRLTDLRFMFVIFVVIRATTSLILPGDVLVVSWVRAIQDHAANKTGCESFIQYTMQTKHLISKPLSAGDGHLALLKIPECL